MALRVLSTSPTFGYYASEPLEYLKSHGFEVQLAAQGEKFSEEELVTSMKELDAIIVGFEKITASALQGAGKLKIIAKHGAGVDNIDVKAASGKGIVVTNAPGTNSDAVADLTIGFFLSLARGIPFADHSVKKGEWPRIVGVQLNDKVLGVIGLGQIGKKVAKRALGFEMRVLAYDVIKDETFAKKWGIKYVSLDEVLTESDFISIHVPITSTTYNLIAERELNLIKKGAFLVNLSRGGIVDEEALCRVLKEERLKGAALDVFANEPPVGSPLLTLDNVILTPHMGGYTVEALRDTGMVCARCIVDVLKGRRPEYIVNPEVLR